jgi:hypothetical protein
MRSSAVSTLSHRSRHRSTSKPSLLHRECRANVRIFSLPEFGRLGIDVREFYYILASDTSGWQWVGRELIHARTVDRIAYNSGATRTRILFFTDVGFRHSEEWVSALSRVDRKNRIL